MAFDLAKAAGLDKIVSNLDTMEIVQIPLEKIDPNEKNFFTVDDVQDLAESIQINGILQPLNVVRAGERYRIIAGHRRFKAAGIAGLKEVPAIILPDMSEAKEWVALIQTNTTARELSYSEKMKAVKQTAAIIIQLKEEGVKLPGRMRDILSEQLEISKTELARMSVIDKNLTDKWKSELSRNNINASCAYELARLPREEQDELMQLLHDPDNEEVSYMSAALVEDYKVRKKCASWIRSDCPIADGCWASELRSKGKLVPCKYYKDVFKHKEKGNPELCCGCCAECNKAETCKDKCQYSVQAIAKKKAAEKNSIEKTKNMEAYNVSDLKPVMDRAKALIYSTCLDASGLADRMKEWFSQNKLPLWKSPNSYEIEAFLKADTLAEVPGWVAIVLTLCDVLDVTPNELFRYNNDTKGGVNWHCFPADKPKDGQRVVVRKSNSGIEGCGEYIYQNGEWLHPGLDHFKMNVTGVTHWVEAPDEG